MSDFESTAAALYTASTGLGSRRDGMLASATPAWIIDDYTTTTGTDESTDDFIVFGRVSKGQVILPALGFVLLESGLSTALVGTLGIRYDDTALTDDYDALSQSLTLSSEGRVWLDPAASAFTGYTVLGAGSIVFDPTTVTSIVESKKLALYVPFINV